jgi:predicted dinucleotide-binding enzyme
MRLYKAGDMGKALAERKAKRAQVLAKLRRAAKAEMSAAKRARAVAAAIENAGEQ